MPTTSFFTSVIDSYLPEPHASLLNGILFGISLKTSKVFYEQLKTVGLLHMVVLSGINITILAVIIGSITSRLGKLVSIFLTFITIVIFILFVGPAPPIIRAGIMGILSLMAIAYGRRNYALYALLMSGFIIAIFWPQWITSISFQLSYMATLGIILFGNTNGVKWRIWQELKPSLAAQIFTLPIIFWNFKQVSLMAPISNLLTSVLIPPLMIFGFLTAFLGKLHFFAGLLPSYVCFVILEYMVRVIDFLSRVPYASIYF